MNPAPPDPLPGAARMARSVKRILYCLGVLLLVLAAVSARTGFGGLRPAREGIEVPVVLRTGQEFRAPLKTSAKAELMIELVLNRHEGVADDVIDKILTRETGAVNVAWLVRKDGTTHFSGSSTNARKLFAGSAAERTKGLGQFKPQQSGTYEFVATLHSDLPELERARPRIVVRPNRAQAMNASMGGSVGVVGGFVLGLFGVIVLLLARREDQSCVR